MSLPALIDLRVCWDRNTKSTAFVNAALCLVNAEESLLDVIKREVRNKVIDATTTINYEHDIKSVISDDRKDLSQIIRVPLSLSISRLSSTVTVVLDKPAPASSTAAAKPAAKEASKYDKLVAKGRTIAYANFTSDPTLDVVQAFWKEFEEASNKEKFLADYDGDKPDIDAQLNAVVVDFLNTNNIKYQKDHGDENAATEGIKKVGKSSIVYQRT